MLTNVLIRCNPIYFNSALFKSSSCISRFHPTVARKTTVADGTRFRTTDDLKELHLEKWVSTLPTEHREQLKIALQKEPEKTSDELGTYLSMKDLVHVGTFHSLPYIGFGFLDNLVMIITGDYIELWFAVYGMSTMAAAGIGNAISDACGIGSAYYVEELSKKLGFPEPILTPAQTNARRTTWAINIGRVVGVVAGCILGMVPLLWRKKREGNKCEACSKKSNEECNGKPKEESKTILPSV